VIPVIGMIRAVVEEAGAAGREHLLDAGVFLD